MNRRALGEIQAIPYPCVMSSTRNDLLSADEVRHVAKLSRLRLTDEQVELYRVQLSAVLDHIRKLNELDVDGVEPLAHPIELVNRLDDDEVKPPMERVDLMRNAPAVEGPYLAVPKVLDDEGGA